MLIFCDECGRYLGEVRPFWDRSISERTCEKCHGEFEEKDDGFDIDSEEVDTDKRLWMNFNFVRTEQGK